MSSSEITAAPALWRTRLEDDLAGWVLPVANRLGVNLTMRWFPDPAAPLGPGAESYPLVCQGYPLGAARLEGGKPADRQLIAAMVTQALRHLELGCMEEGLLDELCRSHESLNAVYEVSRQLWTMRESSETLLELILSRAAGIGRGLRAALFVARDGFIEVRVAAGRLAVPAWPRDRGVVGRALSDRRPRVINHPARVHASVEADPLFADAEALLLAPVETPQGQRAALALWRRGGEEANSSAPIGFGSPTMHLALSLALQAAMVVENERLHAVSLESRRLRQEIEIGSRIQQILLLSRPPARVDGASIAALALSSEQVDGDFLEFLNHGPGCLDVIVGDVMGKGIPAALLGAATKAELLRVAGPLFEGDAARRPPPNTVVARLASSLVGRLIALESFVTLCYARFDLPLRRMTLVDCGHTRTIHYHASEQRCAAISGENTPLGFAVEEAYHSIEVPLGAGDVLVFYSDGLTEARNAPGELYGEGRLVGLIEANAEATPDDLLAAIRRDVEAFAPGPLRDDLTCVVVRIGDEPFSRGGRALVVPSRLEELPGIRAHIRRQAQAAATGPGWSEHALFQLELAVAEAVANIMIHAYRGATDRRLGVELEAGPDRVTVTLRHNGIPLDSHAVPPAHPEGGREGGLGLYIINHAVDRVEYLRDSDGSHLVRLHKSRQDQG